MDYANILKYLTKKNLNRILTTKKQYFNFKLSPLVFFWI